MKINDIFNAALALLGICITALSLFAVTDKRAQHYVDECFAITVGLFLVALLCAFISLKNSGRQVTWLAHMSFNLGLFMTLISGVFLMLEL